MRPDWMYNVLSLSVTAFLRSKEGLLPKFYRKGNRLREVEQLA